MGIMRKRAMAALLFVIAWHGRTSSGGFGALGASRKSLPPARANVQDVLAAVAGAMQNPTVHAIWKAVVEENNMKTTLDFLGSVNTAFKAWQEWTGRPVYKKRGDVGSHVSSLVESIEELRQSGTNTMISDMQESDLPDNPVRGSHFEQLMVATLLDDVPGVVASYAEPGSGKSVAVTLATMEVGRCRNTSDFYVLLQNDLDEELETFFRVSEVSSTAKIATAFFRAPRKQNIRLHLIFDNVLDSGATSDVIKDRLKALARAACKSGHQVLFTMQEKEAADSVANLNGETTNLAALQNSTIGAYRWTQNEATQLIQTLTSDSPPQTEMNITKVLSETKIPDNFGRWRPRAIELFMTYGTKPKAPQRRMQGGWQGSLLV